MSSICTDTGHVFMSHEEEKRMDGNRKPVPDERMPETCGIDRACMSIMGTKAIFAHIEAKRMVPGW